MMIKMALALAGSNHAAHANLTSKFNDSKQQPKFREFLRFWVKGKERWGNIIGS